MRPGLGSSDVRGEAVREDVIQECYINDLEKKAGLFLTWCSAAFKGFTHIFSAVSTAMLLHRAGKFLLFQQQRKYNQQPALFARPLLTL